MMREKGLKFFRLFMDSRSAGYAYLRKLWSLKKMGRDARMLGGPERRKTVFC